MHKIGHKTDKELKQSGKSPDFDFDDYLHSHIQQIMAVENSPIYKPQNMKTNSLIVEIKNIVYSTDCMFEIIDLLMSFAKEHDIKLHDNMEYQNEENPTFVLNNCMKMAGARIRMKAEAISEPKTVTCNTGIGTVSLRVG
ncbi:MAG: hypothetical protein ACTSW7_00715 [Candidatus Thorarchaeota archaeon]|nr:hypothetical protein [Thermoplasmatales archaeon]